MRRLTLSVHIGSPGPHSEVVAVAPSGPERVLLRKAVATPPADFLETVGTGDFFERAGDYRLELRVSGKTAASTTITIADDAKDAVVNACQPISRKK
jgi:hypothetical protein